MKSILFTFFLFIGTVGFSQSFDEKITEANNLFFDDKFEEALSQYQILLESGETDSISLGRAYGYAGLCFEKLGDEANKKEYLIKSVELRTTEIAFYDKLYTAAKKEKDYSLQQLALHTKLDVFPEEELYIKKSLAIIYLNTKQYPKVITTCDYLLTEFPDEFRYHYYKGIGHQQLKQKEEAIVAFSKAYEINHQHARVNQYLGLLLYNKANGGYDREVKRYKAIEKPTGVQWDQHIGNLKQHENNLKETEKYLLVAYNAQGNATLKKCLHTLYMKTKRPEMAVSFQ